MRAISVIIPVRNGADDLAALLGALDRQTIATDKFEVLVGDDGSTEDLGAAIGGREHVRLLAGQAVNAYAARNRAAAAAVGEVFAFTDADCRPVADWLEAGIRALEAGADLAGGQIVWRIDGTRTIWSLLDIDTFVDPELTVSQGAALTGNLFVRRAMFERVGGFDSTLPSHGDYEFAQRCVADGGQLVFAPEAVVTHPTYNAARPFLRKFVEANVTYATRETRIGRTPNAVSLREWVPLVQTIRSRRRYSKSLLLHRRRLADSGIATSRSEQLRALPLVYLLLPYLRAGSQLLAHVRVKRSQAG